MEISSSLNEIPPFHVLIAAAGSGSRADTGGRESLPKQYRKINGQALLRHTIRVFLPFLENKLCKVKIIINPSHQELYEDAVKGLPGLETVDGGADRRESVFRGVESFSGLKDDDLLLVHDAARPFTKQSDILPLLAAAGKTGAATLAVRVADTLRRENGDYVSRDGLWAVQTPQAFRYGLIRRAHEKAAGGAETYTDDTSLVAALGHPVEFVEGSRMNYKITVPDDFAAAEALLAGAMETRTGTGFDVHAFDPAKPGPVRLAGVDVPHVHALLGHSDADAGLHALTDALLGAMAAGDIGQHFPPSDSRWKGKDSAFFLRHAVGMLEDAGGAIVNLDLTLICEAPKIGPHREAMQKRIAEICGIAPARVGVKATTTEGLGFTGRSEGIAAQAVATVRIPAG